MSALQNPQHETFCQAISRGKSSLDAYAIAGYSPNKGNASTLRSKPKIKARLLELLEQHHRIEDRAVERAVERTAISKERIFNEFGSLGFSNMLDYMRLEANGTAVFDWSRLTRDQAAAIVEVTVEEFMDGKGEDARPVRRVKFKLADKIAALSKLGQELGMFINRQHLDVSFEQRLATMTPEQRMELARDMAVRLKEQVARYREIEGKTLENEVSPDEIEPESE